MNGISLLARKKGSLCIGIGLCIVSLFVISFSGEMKQTRAGESYAISIRHYGVDAHEMERSVAIPLEDALYSIPGLYAMQSSSENSLARVFVRFKNRRRGQYEAVRDAAQRVYEGLPSSAQRPEIQSSDNSRIPVWSAAVFNPQGDSAGTARFLERTLKPRLEGLDGAGEVLVSGSGLAEIIVEIDQEKAAALGIGSAAVAWALGANDALLPGGTMLHDGKEIIVSVDGRYGSESAGSGYQSLLDALVPLGDGRAVAVSDIGRVYERERQPDTLSRLNGRKTAVVSVMGNADADLQKLSRDIKREIDALSQTVKFTVLSDRGAEESAAFRSVFSAAIQGACMVALICFFLNRGRSKSLSTGKYAGLFCALSVPAICLISSALLSVCGFPPNRLVLAGMAAGMGAAIDPVILCCEKFRKSRNYAGAWAVLGELRGPLIAGAATTVVALLPLSAMDADTDPIVWAIGAITIIALLLALTLLPPLLLWDMKDDKTDLHQVDKKFIAPNKLNLFKLQLFKLNVLRLNVLRKVFRTLAANARTCIRYPVRVCIAALILILAGIAALVLRGTDPGFSASEDSVYGRIEFEGGLLAQESDRILAAFGEELSQIKGIKNVETGARIGSGTVIISFDRKLIDTNAVRDAARALHLPGGFLFFPETSAKERRWEIKIAGDDEQRCMELAEELARSCAAVPFIHERVLNFKEGSKRLTLQPDRENFASAGLSFSQAANDIRRSVHGPVAYKRTGLLGETDVRFKTLRSSLPEEDQYQLNKDDVMALLLSSNNGALALSSVVKTVEGQEPSSIRREDRRRTASITITTAPVDPRRVKAQLADVLEKQELPPGYSLEFDPEAIQKARALSGSFLLFLLALAFCYMVIAAVNESFAVPLAVLAAVPPSLAVPALCMAIAGMSFTQASACAFVAVSGIAVNAGVLCAAALKHFLDSQNMEKSGALYRALRRRLPALVATTVTTVAGALPFLLLSEGANSLVRTLSLVTALGVGSSCFCSISVVPALSIMLSKLGKKKSAWERNSACADNYVNHGELL